MRTNKKGQKRSRISFSVSASFFLFFIIQPFVVFVVSDFFSIRSVCNPSLSCFSFHCLSFPFFFPFHLPFSHKILPQIQHHENETVLQTHPHLMESENQKKLFREIQCNLHFFANKQRKKNKEKYCGSFPPFLFSFLYFNLLFMYVSSN